ncbi:MAG: hypothetical protein RLZ28_810 [Actinomycetota bacterium]|jgi:hypothetical protein
MPEKKKSKAAEVATADVDNPIDIETPIVLVEKTNATHLNTLAVVSIATSATGFGAVAGIITGHVALSQIRHTAQKGKGLAIAGLVAGYAGLAGFIVMGALSMAGHWAENRYDGHRGPGQMINNGQGPRHFDGRLGLNQGGPMGEGGATIVLPDGQTVTIPDNGGIMGGKGFPDDSGRGPGGMMGGMGFPGDQGPQPMNPMAPDQPKN